MPAETARSRRPRHRGTAAAAAVAAVLTLALAACSGAATARNVSAASSAGPARLTLTGAGSTFDAPFFGRAFAAYHRQNPGVAVRYSAVGSSAGIAAFSAGRVNFGASDVPLTPAEQAAAHGGPSVQIPVDLGAEVVVYNLIGLPLLHLTGPVIARIFLGQITSWSDPAITALNPGRSIPDEPITVVHRSDGSGTTYIFSNYLSAVSPAWKARAGTGKTLHWPAGIGAKGNPGVASSVAHIPFSIGYVERSYSKGPILAYAQIRNQAGHFTTPAATAIAAAAGQKPDVTPADFSIVNEPGAASYPICGYSWALAYTRQPSTRTGKALVNLLTWLTHQGQADAAATSYVPLPPQIQRLATTALHKISGPGG
ncbi:MAG: phosphate ABC transporter substrate-binding protein PstS, partial [Streptosporangiaceae bacterium]